VHQVGFLYAVLWLCFALYNKTNHFEGSTMITERGFPDDGICVVPKHDDLVTSDRHIVHVNLVIQTNLLYELRTSLCYHCWYKIPSEPCRL
jgi:hypothetical protein